MARFNYHANNRDEARQYFQERALQLRIDGFTINPYMEPLLANGQEWGLRALFEKDLTIYQSVFTYVDHRGKGLTSAFLSKKEYPVVTIPDCKLEDFLQDHSIPYVLAALITDTKEYQAIAKHYANRTAQRSGVPLMHHIDEGLTILSRINASDLAKRAYCLHPLLQYDNDLAEHFPSITSLSNNPKILVLAMEYRNIANTSLAYNFNPHNTIPLSPLPEVNDMLVADKVQNRKDFLAYHLHTHPHSTLLKFYFECWLDRLGISEERYEELIAP